MAGAVTTRLSLGPWSFPINEVARAGALELSLLSLSVVDDVVRVAGVMRSCLRPDFRLDGAPELVLGPVQEPPLQLLSAHLLPPAGAIWIEWLFARPVCLPAVFVAHVDDAVLAYRVRGRFVGERVGPLRFEFRIDEPSAYI